MPRKYAFLDGRLYISIEEASSLLREFASAALLSGGAQTLLDVAECFDRIEIETLGAVNETEV